MTGNKPTVTLSGQYLLLLVIFKLIWPQSTIFEAIVFIANESDDARVFSEQDVGRALRRLGYTMKVTSTVAYQAFNERNLNHRRLFWMRPWPVGIHGIPQHWLIDADKFGLHLNACRASCSPHKLTTGHPHDMYASWGSSRRTSAGGISDVSMGDWLGGGFLLRSRNGSDLGGCCGGGMTA
jgi:hypothetical protein